MKLINTTCIFIMVLYISALSAGCNDNSIRERELTLKERELELREKELEKTKSGQSTNTTIPVVTDGGKVASKTNAVAEKSKKFIYIVLKTKEPTLLTVQNDQNSTQDANGHYVALGDRFSYKTIMETNYYTSEVIELDDYTKDKEYKTMDKFEFQIVEKIEEGDREYRSEVDTKVLFNRDSYYEYKSQIVARKSYVFDTYEQASISRKKDKQL